MVHEMCSMNIQCSVSDCHILYCNEMPSVCALQSSTRKERCLVQFMLLGMRIKFWEWDVHGVYLKTIQESKAKSETCFNELLREELAEGSLCSRVEPRTSRAAMSCNALFAHWKLPISTKTSNIIIMILRNSKTATVQKNDFDSTPGGPLLLVKPGALFSRWALRIPFV